MKTWREVAVLCLAFVGVIPGVGVARDSAVGVLTNSGTDAAQLRVETKLDDVWRVGAMGTWYTEDVPEGSTWGLGGYLRYAVDPNATVPVAGFLPAVGEWLSLPESLQGETYLIAPLQLMPIGQGGDIEGFDISAGIGVGIKIGPATLEWIYQIVEGGDADKPGLASGPQLWFGALFEF